MSANVGISIASNTNLSKLGSWALQASPQNLTGLNIANIYNNSTGLITFPYTGIYSLSFGARFANVNSENGSWFTPYGFYNGRFGVNSTAYKDSLSTYTGYFQQSNTISCDVWSGQANTVWTGDTMFSIVLLQKTA